jgi:hypothetical protein
LFRTGDSFEDFARRLEATMLPAGNFTSPDPVDSIVFVPARTEPGAVELEKLATRIEKGPGLRAAIRRFAKDKPAFSRRPMVGATGIEPVTPPV